MSRNDEVAEVLEKAMRALEPWIRQLVWNSDEKFLSGHRTESATALAKIITELEDVQE